MVAHTAKNVDNGVHLKGLLDELYIVKEGGISVKLS